jgi:predicted metal-dependent hydrolase
LLVEWYRGLIEAAAPILIARWAPLMQVTVARVSARHMKTRWGSCTPRSRQIRLSIELAKKPPQCLEYVVVHEMVHLLEASHNRRFVRQMDQFRPQWRWHRRELNGPPRRPGHLVD